MTRSYVEIISSPLTVPKGAAAPTPLPGTQRAVWEDRPAVPSGAALVALARRLAPALASLEGGAARSATLVSVPANDGPCRFFVGLTVPLEDVLDRQVLLHLSSQGSHILPEGQVRLSDIGAYPPSVGSHQVYLFGVRGAPGATMDLYSYAARDGLNSEVLTQGRLECP